MPVVLARALNDFTLLGHRRKMKFLVVGEIDGPHMRIVPCLKREQKS